MVEQKYNSPWAWITSHVDLVGEEPGVLLFLLAVGVLLLFGPGGPLVPGG